MDRSETPCSRYPHRDRGRSLHISCGEVIHYHDAAKTKVQSGVLASNADRDPNNTTDPYTFDAGTVIHFYETGAVQSGTLAAAAVNDVYVYEAETVITFYEDGVVESATLKVDNEGRYAPGKIFYWPNGQGKKALLLNDYTKDDYLFAAGELAGWSSAVTDLSDIIQGTLAVEKVIDGTTYALGTVVRLYHDGAFAGTNEPNLFDDAWNGGVLLTDETIDVGGVLYMFKGGDLVRYYAGGAVQSGTLAAAAVNDVYVYEAETVITFYEDGVVESATLKVDNEGRYAPGKIFYWTHGQGKKALLLNDYTKEGYIFAAGEMAGWSSAVTDLSDIIQGTLAAEKVIDGTTYALGTVVRLYHDGAFAGTNEPNLFDDAWNGGVLLTDETIDVGGVLYMFKGGDLVRYYAGGTVQSGTLAAAAVNDVYVYEAETVITFYEDGVVESATLKVDNEGRYAPGKIFYWPNGQGKKALLLSDYTKDAYIFAAGEMVGWSSAVTDLSDIIQGTLAVEKVIDGTTYALGTVVRLYHDGAFAGTNEPNLFDDAWNGGVLLTDETIDVGGVLYMFKGGDLVRYYAGGAVQSGTLAAAAVNDVYVYEAETVITFYEDGVVESATLKVDNEGRYAPGKIFYWTHGQGKKALLLNDYTKDAYIFAAGEMAGWSSAVTDLSDIIQGTFAAEKVIDGTTYALGTVVRLYHDGAFAGTNEPNLFDDAWNGGVLLTDETIDVGGVLYMFKGGDLVRYYAGGTVQSGTLAAAAVNDVYVYEAETVITFYEDGVVESATLKVDTNNFYAAGLIRLWPNGRVRQGILLNEYDTGDEIAPYNVFKAGTVIVYNEDGDIIQGTLGADFNLHGQSYTYDANVSTFIRYYNDGGFAVISDTYDENWMGGILSADETVPIGGVDHTFGAGTFLRYYPGEEVVQSGVLLNDVTRDGFVYEGGTVITFYEDGVVETATLRDATSKGWGYMAGTIQFYPSGRVKKAMAAVPISLGDGVGLSLGSVVGLPDVDHEFDTPIPVQGTLSADVTLDGIEYTMGTVMRFYAGAAFEVHNSGDMFDDEWNGGVLLEDTTVTIPDMQHIDDGSTNDGVAFKVGTLLKYYPNTDTVKEGILLYPAKWFNTIFEESIRIRFYENRKVSEGTLKEDETGLYRAGEIIHFWSNGMIRKGILAGDLAPSEYDDDGDTAGVVFEGGTAVSFFPNDEGDNRVIQGTLKNDYTDGALTVLYAAGTVLRFYAGGDLAGTNEPNLFDDPWIGGLLLVDETVPIGGVDHTFGAGTLLRYYLGEEVVQRGILLNDVTRDGYTYEGGTDITFYDTDKVESATLLSYHGASNPYGPGEILFWPNGTVKKTLVGTSGLSHYDFSLSPGTLVGWDPNTDGRIIQLVTEGAYTWQGVDYEAGTFIRFYADTSADVHNSGDMFDDTWAGGLLSTDTEADLFEYNGSPIKGTFEAGTILKYYPNTITVREGVLVESFSWARYTIAAADVTFHDTGEVETATLESDNVSDGYQPGPIWFWTEGAVRKGILAQNREKTDAEGNVLVLKAGTVIGLSHPSRADELVLQGTLAMEYTDEYGTVHPTNTVIRFYEDDTFAGTNAPDTFDDEWTGGFLLRTPPPSPLGALLTGFGGARFSSITLGRPSSGQAA